MEIGSKNAQKEPANIKEESPSVAIRLSHLSGIPKSESFRTADCQNYKAREEKAWLGACPASFAKHPSSYRQKNATALNEPFV